MNKLEYNKQTKPLGRLAFERIKPDGFVSFAIIAPSPPPCPLPFQISRLLPKALAPSWATITLSIYSLVTLRQSLYSILFCLI